MHIVAERAAILEKPLLVIAFFLVFIGAMRHNHQGQPRGFSLS